MITLKFIPSEVKDGKFTTPESIEKYLNYDSRIISAKTETFSPIGADGNPEKKVCINVYLSLRPMERLFFVLFPDKGTEFVKRLDMLFDMTMIEGVKCKVILLL